MERYSEADLQNFQDMGAAKTLAEANRQIKRARQATPTELHAKYHSSIRYSVDGYLWAWVLRE